MDNIDLEERILVVVRAASKAEISCDTVEVTIDGTIRIRSSNQVSLMSVAKSPEVEDFFEKHMGKGFASHG